MDQTIGNRMAQQHTMSTTWRMSRHVNHDLQAGMWGQKSSLQTLRAGFDTPACRDSANCRFASRFDPELQSHEWWFVASLL